MTGAVRPLLLAATIVTLASCGGVEPTSAVMDRETFVATMVELRKAALEEPGSYEVRKVEILRARGVTEDELRSFVRAGATDLDELAEVWRAIDQQVNTPVAADTTSD